MACIEATLAWSKERKAAEWWTVATNVACKGVISGQQVVKSRDEP